MSLVFGQPLADKLEIRLVILFCLVALAAIPNVLAQVKKFPNCEALNKVYPHGVGRPGAKDKVSSKKPRPVPNFAVNAALYEANRGKLDRDKDGIACERL